MSKNDSNNNRNVGDDIFKLIKILEDESVFSSGFFCLKVRLRIPHAAKRGSTKIFECLGEMITRLVK